MTHDESTILSEQAQRIRTLEKKVSVSRKYAITFITVFSVCLTFIVMGSISRAIAVIGEGSLVADVQSEVLTSIVFYFIMLVSCALSLLDVTKGS